MQQPSPDAVLPTIPSAPASPFAFLGQRGSQLLFAFLTLHAVAYYSFLSPEPPVNARPLAQFPDQVSVWSKIGEYPVEPEVQEVLKADDTLSRAYASTTDPAQAGLFVAFFRSQQAGQAPHSPKNCLPGSGWEQVKSGTVQLTIPGRAEPIEINRYIVARGENKSMVFYWYQSHGRVVASEYWSKIYLVWDSLRSHRSDTALVRIVVPVIDSDEAKAEKTAIDFVRASFAGLSSLLPS